MSGTCIYKLRVVSFESNVHLSRICLQGQREREREKERETKLGLNEEDCASSSGRETALQVRWMRNVERSEAGIFFEDVPSHLRRRTADVQLIENGQRLTSKRHTVNTHRLTIIDVSYPIRLTVLSTYTHRSDYSPLFVAILFCTYLRVPSPRP